jgi:hypothetical protein
MLGKFGIFSIVLVYCVKKNLATLCVHANEAYGEKPIFEEEQF